MIFSIIVRKKYLYGAFKIIFSPETFSTSLGHTGDNLERRFRRHLGIRGLMLFSKDAGLQGARLITEAS